MRCVALGLLVLIASRLPAPAQETVAPSAPVAAWPAQLPAPDALHLFLPDRDWALVLDMRGFNVTHAAQSQGGRASVALEGADGFFMVTAFLEVLPDADGAAACGAAFRRRAPREPFERSSVRTSDRDGMFLHESTIARFGDQRLDQRNVNAYLDVGDTCIDVHLSKTLFEPKDQGRLDALVGAIRIERPFAPTPLHWLPFALLPGCEAALPALEAIEKLEAGAHRLDRETWRRCVATLVQCRMALDRAPEAARSLEAALREDADYAPFHYAMAAARAKSGDAPGAIEALRRAKAAPAVAGMELPDPLSNPAFADVEADPAFRAAVATLFPGPPAAARAVRLPVAGEGALVLDVPGGWRARRDSGGSASDAAPTYELLGARGARHATTMITILPARGGKDVPATLEELRAGARALARKALPGATSPKVTPLPESPRKQGGPTLGACFTFEDPALAGKDAPPGEWKIVTHCTARAGELLLSVTVFTQEMDAPELALARAMLAGARHEGVASGR